MNQDTFQNLLNQAALMVGFLLIIGLFVEVLDLTVTLIAIVLLLVMGVTGLINQRKKNMQPQPQYQRQPQQQYAQPQGQPAQVQQPYQQPAPRVNNAFPIVRCRVCMQPMEFLSKSGNMYTYRCNQDNREVTREFKDFKAQATDMAKKIGHNISETQIFDSDKLHPPNI